MSSATPCGTLHTRTLELVRNAPRTMTLTEIALGADLPVAWVTSFFRGEIEAPNVNRVQRLYEHLVGRPLVLD